MIDIEKIEFKVRDFDLEIKPKILYEQLLLFNQLLKKIPDEVEILCPISLQPQYYGPRGKPITLYLSILKEIGKWCNIQKNLAPLKCNQLIESYAQSLELNQFLISFQSTRAFIETTAVYKNEWIESENKIEVISNLKPSSFNHALKTEEGFEDLLKKLFDLLTILRAFTQRSRFDWLSVTHDVKPTLGEETEELLRQRNVMTAISKITTLESKYCKTTRDHYEMICDFVHPNRGANMLFVEMAEVNSEYVRHIYSKRPRSSDLLSITLEFTTIPIISCIDEILSVFKEWERFELILVSLINKLKFYEK